MYVMSHKEMNRNFKKMKTLKNAHDACISGRSSKVIVVTNDAKVTPSNP